MKEGPQERWRIHAPDELFQELRGSDVFVAILRLGRVMNAFRFLHIAAVDFSGVEGSPSQQRQNLQALLFSCGLLHEAFQVIEREGQHLRHLASFREELAPLLREPLVKELRQTDLKILRNKVVFHFDRDVIAEALRKFEGAERTIAQAWGWTRGDIHVGLADFLAFHFILDGQADRAAEDGSTPLAEEDRLRDLITAVTYFQDHFCTAAEAVIGEGLRELGCVFDGPTPP